MRYSGVVMNSVVWDSIVPCVKVPFCYSPGRTQLW